MNQPLAPLDGEVVARVRASFGRQGRWRPSAPSLPMSPPAASPSRSRSSRACPSGRLPPRGVVDGACGYAALTLMPGDAEVLTVELKVNLLAPATGDRLVAEGEAVRAGRTLTVCRGDAYSRVWKA